MDLPSAQVGGISPFKRAVQTVRPLAASKGVSIRVQLWLREFNNAMFEYGEQNLLSDAVKFGSTQLNSWEGFLHSDMLRSHEQEICEGVGRLLHEYGLVKHGLVYDGELMRDSGLLLCGHVGSILAVAGFFMNLHPVHCLLTMHVANASVTLFEISQDTRLPSQPYRCWLRFWNRSPVDMEYRA